MLVVLAAPAVAEPTARVFRFTLQIAAFPDIESTEAFASQIVRAGERPFWGSINIPGRGVWFRVYIGEFDTAEGARVEGQNLLTRGIIREFIVKRASEVGSLSRSRRLYHKRGYPINYESRPASSAPHLARRPAPHTAISPHNKDGFYFQYPVLSAAKASRRAVALPIGARIVASDANSASTSFIPRPDPVRLAFKIVAGEGQSGRGLAREQGGLWLSGDVEQALARLQWIVGAKNAHLLCLDEDGRLRVDAALLAESIMAGTPVDPAGETLRVADYIYSNEGLLLIVQMALGPHSYLLHIGSKAPTFGDEITVNGSVNLDNNFDSRINPYRRTGKKLSVERPPSGFDAMIAMNPIARWLNLRVNRIVPVGHITFHELAEAYAKVSLGLDYLGNGLRPGAHNVAIERERILQAQRPGSDIVLTAGSNRVLRSSQEIRQTFAETSGPVDPR
jgi:hypothetical protein